MALRFHANYSGSLLSHCCQTLALHWDFWRVKHAMTKRDIVKCCNFYFRACYGSLLMIACTWPWVGRHLTRRRVDQLVSEHWRRRGVPGHTEAGVPLVWDAQAQGLQQADYNRGTATAERADTCQHSIRRQLLPTTSEAITPFPE